MRTYSQHPKSVAFLYTNNEQTEEENSKHNSILIASKIPFLVINKRNLRHAQQKLQNIFVKVFERN